MVLGTPPIKNIFGFHFLGGYIKFISAIVFSLLVYLMWRMKEQIMIC